MLQEAYEGNATIIYVRAFIDELVRSGMRHAVICPGSRSTPLALCCAAHPEMRVWMHIDERSASFFALGMAKRLRQPVALICTSGTAAANFYPAIIEAKLTHIPLLVLTADRPPELRENGAPQTIDQNRLYATHVKWFHEVALPEATNAALRYIRTIACRALAHSSTRPEGPVHLNLPLREPLVPHYLTEQPVFADEQRDPLAWEGRPQGLPYVVTQQSSLQGSNVHSLLPLLRERRRGLIIVGPQSDPDLAAALIPLAQRLGYPLLADPLSSLRCGEHDQSGVITSYDAFIRLSTFVQANEPDLILRIGAMPTSKPVLLYLKTYAQCPQLVIDGYHEWSEPTQLASQIIYTDPVSFCRELNEVIHAQSSNIVLDHAWLQTWIATDHQTKATLTSAIQSFVDLFEGRIFLELAQLLPERSTLYVGNSMPVRDLDTFFWGSGRALSLVGNRGANGIDGIVSSALGWSAASAVNDPMVLVIGDLSFLHDLQGLLAAKLYHLNLIVILVQNDGGGIFSFLPQAQFPEHFEQLFGTPTGINPRPAVEMYGGSYYEIHNWVEFQERFQQAVGLGGLHVLEVRTDRARNVILHRQLWAEVERVLNRHEEL